MLNIFSLKIGKKSILELLQANSIIRSWNVKRISIIPTNIGLLKNILSIYLPDNNISVIPTEIGLLNNLKILDLSNNYIEYIPTEISLLDNLTDLKLSNNKLKYIPPEIGMMPNLSLFYFDNNNIKCSDIPDEILCNDNINIQYMSTKIYMSDIKRFDDTIFTTPTSKIKYIKGYTGNESFKKIFGF